MKEQNIECSCSRKECPAYSKCCFLPTEYYPSPEGTVDILFVGQGGGKDERKQQRPFIGPAGKRLRKQILCARKNTNHFGVAFSNTIRDNPEGNRAPSEEELNHCLTYLYEDIAKLKRMGLKAVVPLGNAAKKALIKDAQGAMGSDRGKVFYVFHDLFGSVPMIPTYHPSSFLFSGIIFKPHDLHDRELLVVGDMIRALRIR